MVNSIKPAEESHPHQLHRLRIDSLIREIDKECLSGFLISQSIRASKRKQARPKGESFLTKPDLRRVRSTDHCSSLH